MSSEGMGEEHLSIPFFMGIWVNQIIGITSLYLYNNRENFFFQDGMLHKIVEPFPCKWEKGEVYVKFSLTGEGKM